MMYCFTRQMFKSLAKKYLTLSCSHPSFFTNVPTVRFPGQQWLAKCSELKFRKFLKSKGARSKRTTQKWSLFIAPEKWWFEGWSFPFGGRGLFSGAIFVKLQVGTTKVPYPKQLAKCQVSLFPSSPFPFLCLWASPGSAVTRKSEVDQWWL